MQEQKALKREEKYRNSDRFFKIMITVYKGHVEND